MDSGLAADDQYNLYSKPLFAERGSNLYRPNKAQDDEAHGGEGADDKDVHSERFKPTKVSQHGPACIHTQAPRCGSRDREGTIMVAAELIDVPATGSSSPIKIQAFLCSSSIFQHNLRAQV